jgi:hypothetical protein
MLIFIRKTVFSKLSVLCLKSNFSGTIHVARKNTINSQLAYYTFLRTFSANLKATEYTHHFEQKNVHNIQHICNNYLSLSSKSYGAKKSTTKTSKNSKGKSNKTIDDILDELSDDEEESNQEAPEPTEYSRATTPAATFIDEFQKFSGKKGKWGSNFIFSRGAICYNYFTGNFISRLINLLKCRKI